MYEELVERLNFLREDYFQTQDDDNFCFSAVDADMLEEAAEVIEDLELVSLSKQAACNQLAEAIEKLQSELEQVKAERETYKMFFDDVTGKPDCNDCGRLECEYKPKVGETTRFNCPLWRGVQGGKGND